MTAAYMARKIVGSHTQYAIEIVSNVNFLASQGNVVTNSLQRLRQNFFDNLPVKSE